MDLLLLKKLNLNLNLIRRKPCHDSRNARPLVFLKISKKLVMFKFCSNYFGNGFDSEELMKRRMRFWPHKKGPDSNRNLSCYLTITDIFFKNKNKLLNFMRLNFDVLCVFKGAGRGGWAWGAGPAVQPAGWREGATRLPDRPGRAGHRRHAAAGRSTGGPTAHGRPRAGPASPQVGALLINLPYI